MKNDIKVNKELCVLCGTCANICPVGIFRIAEGTLSIAEKKLETFCLSCGHCVAVCPAQALTLKGKGRINMPSCDTEILKEQLPRLIKQRRSIRFFSRQPVSPDTIALILDLVRYAPSAKNRQAVAYTFLTGTKLTGFITECYQVSQTMPAFEGFSTAFYHKNKDPLFNRAPAVLFAHAPKDYSWGLIDSTIALSIFSLAAPVYKLDTCWAGFVMAILEKDSSLGDLLSIPAENKIYGVLLLGHTDIAYQGIPYRNEAALSVIN